MLVGLIYARELGNSGDRGANNLAPSSSQVNGKLKVTAYLG